MNSAKNHEKINQTGTKHSVYGGEGRRGVLFP